MTEYEEVKDIIDTIYSMNLSDLFMEDFNKLVYYLKNYNKFRCWELVNALYPAVKLEDNITNEQISYIKNSLLEIGEVCK